MAHRLSSRLTSLLRHHHHHSTTTPKPLLRHFTTATSSNLFLQTPPFPIRFFSTRPPRRPSKPDIGARARQHQARRLWAYGLTFSCIAGFVIIVISQFQDQMVFYVTPSEALEKYTETSKSKFRLGGLVLDGSVAQIPSSPETQFVITDLLTDMLVKYEGSLPDLFREGHSVVVEGFVKPLTDEMKAKEAGQLGKRNLEVTGKARGLDCYFDAAEVLAKHDEKYMPAEVANALEKNKKILEAEGEEKRAAAAAAAAAAGEGTAAA